MKILIYGKTFNLDFKTHIEELFDILKAHNVEYYIYKPFLQFMLEHAECTPLHAGEFNTFEDTPHDADLMISIGGDGTFLAAVPFVRDFDIPIIGLNSGRLGFLANIAKDEITEALQAIFDKNFEIEYRTLIKLENDFHLFDELNFALNEVTLLKKDSSMITVDAYLDNEYLNTYWTDGLIVSTPTGSTAYSLSVGGPIITPDSENFIIAPIASHNLTVRPLVIPDTKKITLKVRSRSNNYLITADNRTTLVKDSFVVHLCKAEFRLKMLKLSKSNFYSTIRNKLMWGVDKRN
ncbi:MAG: NAD kinase [Bacteroidales bacterium]|nr:NAD kinase [Bacteroidales bacterium]